MKKVYVYKFIPTNEIRCHTVTTKEELLSIHVLASEEDKYNVIYELNAEEDWDSVATNIMYTLNRIFEETGSVIRFDNVSTHSRMCTIRPFIYTQDNAFIDTIRFNETFYNYVSSILSDLGTEVVRYNICEGNGINNIVFRRKENVE